MIKSGYLDSNKNSCNIVHGDDIEDELLENEDPSDTDDCMSTITFTDEDMLLGSKLHNRPLFVAGYVREQKVNRILIDGGSAVNIIPLRILKELEIPIDELFNSRFMIQGFNQGGQRAVRIIRLQLTVEDMVSTALFHVIDAKTSYNMLLGRPWLHENAIVPSTCHQSFKYCRNGIVKKVLGDSKPFTEAESHFADAKYYIEGAKKEKEVLPSEEPKTYTGYNPKEKPSLGKLPPEATGRMLHGLNTTQIMLKKKGHAVQDSRVGLGFTPPKPVRIAIRKKDGYQKKGSFNTTYSKKNTKSSPTQKLRSLIPSRMRRQTTLAISCGKVLKVKAQIMVFTQVQSDDEDDRKSVVSSNYINNSTEEDFAQIYHVTLIEDGEIEEEDAEDAPVELEEGVKATLTN
ncbi:UNVERIFIED_CONTAM: hypothetical protein Slati_1444400 [Sesamum latifolium]|uniref:Uncharacterized protein n=1 Tax=Sesamum latifolium TaxID=2727402 RepID=A0AAW2X611_9LAMI